jgi:hypothetical protein
MEVYRFVAMPKFEWLMISLATSLLTARSSGTVGYSIDRLVLV